MARRLIDCVGKAVKAGRLNENEAALLLQRTERFAHLTKEQAELNAANSVLTEQMTELSNLEKQVGPPGKAEVVYKTKDKDAAMAMMRHEEQIVTENKRLAKQREVEGEGAIKTQRQVAVEQEMQAIIKEPVPEGETKPGTHEARLQVYGKIKEKLTGLIGRHAAEIAKLEFKAGMTIGTSEGLTAEEIATQEIDRAKLGEIDKAKLLSALGELDALLKYLPAEVRGRVGGFYQLAKGSMGEKTLTEFFTKRIRMVERAFEQVLVKEYRGALDKLLASTKPKKAENRVRKSTLGPDVQDEADLARRASEMDAAQVADTLDKIEAALQKEGLTDEARGDLMEEWAIVNGFGDLQYRNAEDLSAAHEWLSAVVKEGRSQWRSKEEARREKTRGRVEKVLTGLPKATEPGLAKLEKKDLASIARQLVLSHFSYQQFLEHVLPETAAFKKEWADRARRADVKTQDQALDAGNRLTAALQGVVGSKGRMAMANALYSLKEVHANAVQKDGEAFPMSKLHAVQYLLSWAQPDVREKMINTGWKQESIDQMVALTADDKSQAVMAFLRKEYADTYKLLNPVYRRMFGMNMPRIENYAPTYYETTKADTGMDPFGSPMAGSGLTPGLLKARVAHDAKIRHVDALSAYWQHVGHAYHWANYAELMREMRGVLNDTEVFGAIKQKHGQPVGELVNSWLDALGRQGMSKAADVTWLTRMIDGLVGAKAVSTLGLNLRSVAMQTDSAMRAILAVPMRRVIAAMTDRNFISNVAAAWKSDTVQRRVMSGGTPEAKYLFDRTQFRPSMLLELSRYSMVPMQWTDGFLTSISSAIVYTDAYNEAIKSGVAAPQAEAMAADAMDEAVYRYSQPVGLSAKSLMEVSGGAIRKMFMLFMSDPRLKTALMADSFISLAKGQGKAGDHVRRLVGIEAMSLVSLLIQNLYRDAFSDDDDEEIWTMGGLIRALTLPMLSGWFVLGTVAEIGITTAVGEKAFEPTRDPTIDAWKRANQAFRHLDDLFDTDDPNAMLREWDNIARGAALAGGVFGPIGAAPGVGLSVLVNVLKPLVGAYENVQKEE